MRTVGEILELIEKLAPYEKAAEGDNCGLLVGSKRQEVRSVLVALDITSESIDEAVRLGAGVIAAHHPLFFNISKITDDSAEGRLIQKLIRADISAICMHTNLDAAESGINHIMAELLNIPEPRKVFSRGLGLFGEYEKAAEVVKFAEFAAETFDTDSLRYMDAGKLVKRVGICSGAGGSVFHEAVEAGCDTFLCGDVKYHLYLEARELGINIVDAGHFATENVIVRPLARAISANFDDVNVFDFANCGEPFMVI